MASFGEKRWIRQGEKDWQREVKRHGELHPDSLRLRAVVGRRCQDAGLWADATTHLEAYLAGMKKIVNGSLVGMYLADRDAAEPDTVTRLQVEQARVLVAKLYLQTGRRVDAIAMLEQALAFYEQYGRPDAYVDIARESAMVRAELIGAYLAETRVGDALAIWPAYLDYLDRTFGSDHADTLSSRDMYLRTQDMHVMGQWLTEVEKSAPGTPAPPLPDLSGPGRPPGAGGRPGPGEPENPSR